MEAGFQGTWTVLYYPLSVLSLDNSDVITFPTSSSPYFIIQWYYWQARGTQTEKRKKIIMLWIVIASDVCKYQGWIVQLRENWYYLQVWGKKPNKPTPEIRQLTKQVEYFILREGKLVLVTALAKKRVMTSHRNHTCAMRETIISNLWALPENLGIFLKIMSVCCGQKFS